MPRVFKLLAIVLATSLPAAACVGKGANAPAPQDQASVVVQNRAFIDVDVFALYGGSRARLGSVTANGSGSFRIPAAVVGAGRELRFMVDPVGSTRQGVSFNMFVRPGERVTLTVPPTIAN